MFIVSNWDHLAMHFLACIRWFSLRRCLFSFQIAAENGHVHLAMSQFCVIGEISNHHVSIWLFHNSALSLLVIYDNKGGQRLWNSVPRKACPESAMGMRWRPRRPGWLERRGARDGPTGRFPGIQEFQIPEFEIREILWIVLLSYTKFKEFSS